jgi:Zn finger protein HypA/HybF involved in hydrogenase expression
MGQVAELNRSLEQELFALLRGASLECLVCGEFVLHVPAAVVCPECRSLVFRNEASVRGNEALGMLDELLAAGRLA